MVIDLARISGMRSAIRGVRSGDGRLRFMAAVKDGQQRSATLDWRRGDCTVRNRDRCGRSVERDSLRRAELIPASYGLRWRPSSRRDAGVGQRARLNTQPGSAAPGNSAHRRRLSPVSGADLVLTDLVLTNLVLTDLVLTDLVLTDLVLTNLLLSKRIRQPVRLPHLWMIAVCY